VVVTHADQVSEWRAGEDVRKSIGHALCPCGIVHLAWVDRAGDGDAVGLALFEVTGTTQQAGGNTVRFVVAT
jgi:hypothetical protein